MKGGSRNPFQSTLPARGATTFDISAAAGELISIHAPCTGSDAIAECTCAQCGAFQSTLPARGATGVVHQALKPQKAISIHAPCTGSDLSHFALYNSLSNFNPRSLHGERRLHAKALFCPTAFQSTLPARGATNEVATYIAVERISIHAPCTGSDEKLPVIPTSNYTISIHAPCTGSDSLLPTCGRSCLYFNPRSLHGERPSRIPTLARLKPFQSTLPARGATYSREYNRLRCTAFQSTLPARGATAARRTSATSAAYFNPRSLHGERRDGSHAVGC